MKVPYYFLFLAIIVTLIYVQEVGLALFIGFVVLVELVLIGTAKLASKTKGTAKWAKESLDSEFKELEAAKTNHPEEIVKDQIKDLGKLFGEEFLEAKKKKGSLAEGSVKGLKSTLKTSKKLFKK